MKQCTHYNPTVIFYFFYSHMIEQMVAKHQNMQQRHAEASSYRQPTTTQEFEGAATGSKKEDFPPDWMRMWDNAGKRVYYFNRVDHDMQTNIVNVQERAALAALDNKKTDEYADTIYPDGVLSGNKNTIQSLPCHRPRHPLVL
jgi:hypothetical protein